MKWSISILAILVVTIASCSKSNSGSEAPNISFQAVAPDVVQNGNPEDNVFIFFRIADADADLGNDQNGLKRDIFVKDSRDTTVEAFFFPVIPDEIKDMNKGIEGICTLKINAALFLTLRDDHPEGDTLQYEIYVKDIAGNESNRITTSNIYIVP